MKSQDISPKFPAYEDLSTTNFQWRKIVSLFCNSWAGRTKQQISDWCLMRSHKNQRKLGYEVAKDLKKNQSLGENVVSVWSYGAMMYVDKRIAPPKLKWTSWVH